MEIDLAQAKGNGGQFVSVLAGIFPTIMTSSWHNSGEGVDRMALVAVSTTEKLKWERVL